MGRRVCRNYYTGHTDKTKGNGGSRGGWWVWLGWGRGVGRKCRQQQLNNNKISKKKKKRKEIMTHIRCLQETHHRLKVKGWKEILQANGQEKRKKPG